jgi:DNA-binding transcriptional MerR regulator
MLAAPPSSCQTFVQILFESGCERRYPPTNRELSRRSGVSPDLLRAWERRYGLLRPSRSAGGLRLYSQDDLARVQAMQQHLAAGLAAAEAAAAATSQTHRAETTNGTTSARDELDAALLAFDEGRSHAVLDALIARFSLDTVLSDVVLPYLHGLGERWERGEVSVAQEHFASALLRGRLLGLARGWGQGLGPTALLACAPGEQHDLGLIAFGLALRARGWRTAARPALRLWSPGTSTTTR